MPKSKNRESSLQKVDALYLDQIFQEMAVRGHLLVWKKHTFTILFTINNFLLNSSNQKVMERLGSTHPYNDLSSKPQPESQKAGPVAQEKIGEEKFSNDK